MALVTFGRVVTLTALGGASLDQAEPVLIGSVEDIGPIAGTALEVAERGLVAHPVVGPETGQGYGAVAR